MEKENNEKKFFKKMLRRNYGKNGTDKRNMPGKNMNCEKDNN